MGRGYRTTGGVPAGACRVGWFLIPLALCMPAGASGPASADAEKGDGSGAKFFNLRYDEDFRYFDEDVEAYNSHPLNKLKNIYLDDTGDWRLDLGGEFRLRFESRSNQFYGLQRETQDAQQNYRYLIHANLRHGDLFRVFAQGIFAHSESQMEPFLPTQENHGDLQQLFFDFRFLGEDIPLTLRLGRQELQYGESRWVGPLEWTSTRRRFDAVKLFYEGEKWNLDAFYAKPVMVQKYQHDRWNEQVDFYGVYATYKGIPNHGIDLYFFGLDQTEDAVNPNGRIGDQDIYTIGTRFWGATPPWDYNAELAGQWGHFAGDRVQAWSFNVDLGYTWEVAWRPRLGVGFDYTSGDDDPNDGTVGTINQLFPFNSVCLGYIDLIGRQNMTMAYVNVDAWPIKDKLKSSVTLHSFWLSEKEDFLYDAGAGGVLRDPTGNSGREVGQELDLALEWVVSKNTSVWLAYSYMWADNFVHEAVRDADDPQLFLVQFQYRF